jgi:protein tyrosine phosphatase (PTP) superfamily phosphohydrolase (DUF442 family)
MARPPAFLLRHTGPLLLALLAGAPGCAPDRSPPPQPARTAPDRRPANPGRVEAPGLHNVYRLSDRLCSGSGPEGDAAFASLRTLGVKTVLSVDGARPDLDRARRHGLRYVHLPIGYDGVPQAQALRIARAVRDLPGPVYLHCHHGKHRGPAAAAVALLCLDPQCPIEAAVAFLKTAGTDPRYTGLHAAPRNLRRPTTAELDRVPAEFPEVAKVAALAQAMVEVDTRWERLREVRKAGWRTPKDHPDLDPPHEAFRLAEQYHEAGRLVEVEGRPPDLRRWLAEAEAGAKALGRVLRGGKEKGAVDGPAAAKLFRRAGAACSGCHGKYRDVPSGR